MTLSTSTSKTTTTRPDPELVARRVRGAVAADFQAIEIRERWRRESTRPDPQDIFRRLEAIESAIFQLHNMALEPAA